MIRRVIQIILLTALVAGCGMADQILFGSLSGTTNIGEGSTPLTLQNLVTFSLLAPPADSGTVDQNGVHGTTDGVLQIDFNGAPVYGFMVNFDIHVPTDPGGTPTSIPALFPGSVVTIGGTDTDISADTTGPGTFPSLYTGVIAFQSPSGTPIQSATLNFNFLAADTFDITAMDVTATPEPGTMLLMASALLGIGATRYVKRHRA